MTLGIFAAMVTIVPCIKWSRYEFTNLYTFCICSYEGFGLEAPPVQIPHMGPYKIKYIIVCEVISTLFNVQFTSNLKDDISV